VTERRQPLARIAQRAFGVPLMVEPGRAEAMLRVLGPRLGIDLPAIGAFEDEEGYGAEADGEWKPYRIDQGIAIVPVQGTLIRRGGWLDAMCGVASYESIAADVTQAIEDPAVSAVLLDMDSAGGEVAGVFDLADKLYGLRGRKPIWAAANEMAFSAAYAIASACDVVAVTRTAGVGSIGVISMHVDYSKAEAAAGLKVTLIHAGERKTDLNPHQPLDPTARALWQAEVDRCYALFCGTVARNRGLSVDVVRATEAGLFWGDAAVDAGLADRVESFEETMTAIRGAAAGGGFSVIGGMRMNAKTNKPKATAEAEVPEDQAPTVAPETTDTATDEPADPADTIEAVATAGLPTSLSMELVRAKATTAQVRDRITAETARAAAAQQAELQRQAEIRQIVKDARTANPAVPDEADRYIAAGFTGAQARVAVDQLRVALQSPEFVNAHAAQGAKARAAAPDRRTAYANINAGSKKR
jgi:capsid assembly protease